ncbi:MAG TPA: hypothetical protein VJY35_12975 [Candidatus Eisenbacteria bacterium]|nr:hypothetical protein [Candidatus Eisenbacteria bacterium]
MLKQAPLYVLLLVAPAAASAAGINLSWNDCFSSRGPATNQDFACDTNTGSHVLVATFDPPAGVTKLIGASAVVDVATDGSDLPSWWQLGVGGCRAASLQLDLGSGETPFCSTYWPGVAAGSLAYTTGAGGFPFRMRIHVSMGIPEAIAGAVDSGTEYYGFRLLLDNAASTGAGACAGCDVPACIILTSIWLYQPPAFGDLAICSPLLSNVATWQGGRSDCTGAAPWWPTDCATTPAQNRTWGAIKSLYR